MDFSLEEFSSNAKQLLETILMQQDSGGKLPVSSGEKADTVKAGEIVLVSHTEKGILIQKADNHQMVANHSIEELWKMLIPHGFLRISENHIIHPGFLVKINTGKECSVLLKSGELFPVGDSWKEAVINYFENMNTIGIF